MDRLAAPPSTPAPAEVLAKAASRAGAWLGLSEQELLQALELEAVCDKFEAGSTAWYSALSLIHLAYRLEKLAGSQSAAHQWLRGPNAGLGRPPIERLLEPGGASALLDYTHAYYR
jgi:hypothetical protein